MRKLRISALILSLTVSGAASAGNNVTLKQLSQGEPAPYSGTLIDEEGLREIDIQMAQGEACERRIQEKPSCASSSPSLFGSLLYLAAGAVLGGIVILGVAK